MRFDVEPTTRRVGKLVVSCDLLADLFADGPHAYVVTRNGIPAGSRILGCHVDHERQHAVIYFEAPETAIAIPTMPPCSMATSIHPLRRDLTFEDLYEMRRNREVAASYVLPGS